MRLEELIGKNIIKLIKMLPYFDWKLVGITGIKNIKLKTLHFVEYDIEKPRNIEEIYFPIEISKELELLSIRRNENRQTGLISKVEFEYPFQNSDGYGHIPMVDFDAHNDPKISSEKEAIEVIKESLLHTEIEEGVILRSSSKRNYYFMGIGRVLSETQFLTFLGLCLTMRDSKGVNLADSRHIGHTLSAMKYMAELENKQRGTNWSAYDFEDRFATLRVTPKEGNILPIVIDIYGRRK